MLYGVIVPIASYHIFSDLEFQHLLQLALANSMKQIIKLEQGRNDLLPKSFKFSLAKYEHGWLTVYAAIAVAVVHTVSKLCNLADLSVCLSVGLSV